MKRSFFWNTLYQKIYVKSMPYAVVLLFTTYKNVVTMHINAAI